MKSLKKIKFGSTVDALITGIQKHLGQDNNNNSKLNFQKVAEIDEKKKRNLTID